MAALENTQENQIAVSAVPLVHSFSECLVALADRHHSYKLVQRKNSVLGILTFCNQCLFFSWKNNTPKGGNPHGKLGFIQRDGQLEKGDR